MTFEKNWFAAQEGRAAQISQLWDSPNRGKVMIQSATARPAVMFARSERPQSVFSRTLRLHARIRHPALFSALISTMINFSVLLGLLCRRLTEYLRPRLFRNLFSASFILLNTLDVFRQSRMTEMKILGNIGLEPPDI